MVAEAVAGGVDWILVRGDQADAQALLAACVAIREACTAPLAVAERADVAVAAGAGALVLPRAGLPVWAARCAAPGMLVGASAHSRDEARQLAAARVDYLTVGPVFGSSTPGEKGLALLRSVVAAVKLPVLATGGINAANLPAVLKSGCSGVVVKSGILNAADPRAAARQLIQGLAAAMPRVSFTAVHKD